MKSLKALIKQYILSEWIEGINKEEKKVFIFLAADYGNMGDIAITYAQRKFLEENLKNYKIYEINLKNTYRKMNCIRKNINESDIITIIGGGNMGDLYIDFEKQRRDIITTFKKNKIISFPQSIDFSDTKIGKIQKQKSKIAYKKNKNLVIFAREKKSYEIMKELFSANKVKLVPDIVLSLGENEKENIARENILICLRDDKENFIDINKKKECIEELEIKYKNVIFQDTHIGKENVTLEKRSERLNDMLNQFRKSKIVITDRLHGMIFSVITNTPCIVFKNSNHKIEQTYKNWLKGTKNLFFMEECQKDNIFKIIEKIDGKSLEHINFKVLYEELKKSIIE